MDSLVTVNMNYNLLHIHNLLAFAYWMSNLYDGCCTDDGSSSAVDNCSHRFDGDVVVVVDVA